MIEEEEEEEEVIYRILAHLHRLSSRGWPTGPSSEETKPRIRLLGIDALEIVHGTVARLR